jgi:hypothetical protein
MQLSQLPINEILLAILSFGLGVAATFLGQMISRKLKFIDARNKLRYENSKKFRVWMEAYRDILKCSYPEIYPFWLSQVIAPPLGIPIGEAKFERDQAVTILRQLKEYRDIRRVVDKASEIGKEAFDALIERPSRFNLKARWLYSKGVFNLGVGFTIEVIGHLRKFHTIFDFLYTGIEKNYAKSRIDWDAVDIITPEELDQIVLYAELRNDRQNLSQLKDDYYGDQLSNLADALSSISWKKRQANQELEEIFSVIRKYEQKWVVPES